MDFETRKKLTAYSIEYEKFYKESKCFYTPNQVNEIIGILMTMSNFSALEYINNLQGKLSNDIKDILE